VTSSFASFNCFSCSFVTPPNALVTLSKLAANKPTATTIAPIPDANNAFENNDKPPTAIFIPRPKLKNVFPNDCTCKE
jgi:hypothetical protein